MTLPLALSGDQWIALVGVLSGALVGIVGVGFAYFNGKSERAHAERIARSGRLHEQRFKAYVEIATYLARQRLFLARTEPLWESADAPGPPSPLSDEEWAALGGLAAVSPSREVLDALEHSQREARNFEDAVIQLRAAQKTAEGSELTNHYQQKDNARQRALIAIADTERAMREELAAL
jgi:hypothetical protein